MAQKLEKVLLLKLKLQNRRKYQHINLHAAQSRPVDTTVYNYALQNMYLYFCMATHIYSHDVQMMMRNCSNLARLIQLKFDNIHVLQHIYSAIRLYNVLKYFNIAMTQLLSNLAISSDNRTVFY